MRTKPKKGKGERLLDCPHYENCLDFAAIQNWRQFNCEECSLYKAFQNAQAAPVKKDNNTRICKDCNEKPTISPKHSLCASCMARLSNKKRLPKKKVLASPKRKGNPQGQGRHRPEIGQPRANFEVVFSGKYSQFLKEIEKLAEEEIRTVDEQIIFILKNYLKGIK